MAIKLLSSRKSAPRIRQFLSIRARLMVIALLAVVPLMLDRVRVLEAGRAERIELAHAEAIELAKRGAEGQREIIASVRALVQVMARTYVTVLAHEGPWACNAYVADLTTYVSWIKGLSIVGSDGRIRCATSQIAVGIDVSDRKYYQQAMRTRDFVLSDYIIERVRQTPAIVAAYPAVGEEGAVAGMVLASVNLQWFGQIVSSTGRRIGASVLLIDGKGSVMAANGGDEIWVGKNVDAHTLVRHMLTRDDGTLTTLGLDGVRRIFAFVRVPWTDARLAVGLDESAVLSSADREIGIAYAQLLLFGFLVLLIAWFGGDRLIVKPIQALVRTAARFGRGELHVRPTEQAWATEFEPLAIALEDMAGKLAAREEELRVANKHLEEMASLDALSGLANRRGFDARLQAEWQKALRHGQPLALLMVDVDHFKLFNDHYGHVEGDACLRAVGDTLSIVTIHDAVMVARYGGEEFALLLPGIDIDKAVEAAERARRAIEMLGLVNAAAPSGHVTVSIGVASRVPAPGEDASDLVEAADAGLYGAKRRGRNAVVAHTPVKLLAAG
jgi:diguanylate cyclase (GGDEF)-like protein